MIEQHNSLAEKFLKKGTWLYVFTIVGSLIAYLIKIILSQDLSVSEIGILYGIMSFITLFMSFNDFGMVQSMNRYLPYYISHKEYDKVKTVFFYAFGIQVLTGFLVFLFLYFCAGFLATHYFHAMESFEIIKIFAFFFLGQNFLVLISTFFQAIQDTFLEKFVFFLRMFFTLVGIGIVSFLDIGTLTLYSWIWVGCLYIGIVPAFYFFYTKYYRPFLSSHRIFFSFPFFKEMFSYASVAFLGEQAALLLSQIDMQMVTVLLGSESAGYYTNYLSLVTIPFTILGPVLTFFFPLFSEMVAKKHFTHIKVIKNFFVNHVFPFVFVFSIILFFLGEILATILFGEKFKTSGTILQYSAFFLIFNFFLQINFSIFGALGLVKYRLFIVLVGIVINVILNYLGIQWFGVMGPALATGLTWIVMSLVSEERIISHYKEFLDQDFRITLDFIGYIKNFLVFLGVGYAVGYFVPSIASLSVFYQLMCLVGIFGICAFLYFLVNFASLKGILVQIREIVFVKKSSS